MRITITKTFAKCYAKMPSQIKDKTDQAIRKLERDPGHPSLHTKKIQGAAGLWEMRIDLSYRITANIIGDEVILRRVGKHDILTK